MWRYYLDWEFEVFYNHEFSKSISGIPYLFFGIHAFRSRFCSMEIYKFKREILFAVLVKTPGRWKCYEQHCVCLPCLISFRCFHSFVLEPCISYVSVHPSLRMTRASQRNWSIACCSRAAANCANLKNRRDAENSPQTNSQNAFMLDATLLQIVRKHHHFHRLFVEFMKP